MKQLDGWAPMALAAETTEEMEVRPHLSDQTGIDLPALVNEAGGAVQ